MPDADTFLDCWGVPWRYDPGDDRWHSPTAVLDWDDMNGWHPEVVTAWARASVAEDA